MADVTSIEQQRRFWRVVSGVTAVLLVCAVALVLVVRAVADNADSQGRDDCERTYVRTCLKIDGKWVPEQR